MTPSWGESTDPLEVYDELVMAGAAPDAHEFCRRYPDHPDLAARIRALDALRTELDGLARDLWRDPEEWPREIGGFLLLERLGQGGMGVVFLAQEVATRRRCAVKLLASRSAIALSRFRREARVIQELVHPGIPVAYGFGVVRGQAFLATELLSGTSLAALLEESFGMKPIRSKEPLTAPPRHLLPMDLAGVVQIAADVADTLAYAHERGVIHRDVKPANIMITDQGATKLIDFGLAFEALSGERLTKNGLFLGSPSYAAPEQLRGEQEAIGPWTDTYSLGVTLFEMLAHRTPFRGERDGSETVREGPRHFNPDVPRALEKIVMKALAFAPEERYVDGEAFARALSKWLKR